MSNNNGNDGNYRRSERTGRQPRSTPAAFQLGIRPS